MAQAYEWFKAETGLLSQVGQAESARAHLGHYTQEIAEYPDAVFVLSSDGKYTKSDT